MEIYFIAHTKKGDFPYDNVMVVLKGFYRWTRNDKEIKKAV